MFVFSHEGKIELISLEGTEREKERWRERERPMSYSQFVKKREHLREKNKMEDKRQVTEEGRAAEEEQSQKGDLEEPLFSQLCSCACWPKCPKLHFSSGN